MSADVGRLDVVMTANADGVTAAVDKASSGFDKFVTKARDAGKSVTASSAGLAAGIRAGTDGAIGGYQALQDAGASLFSQQHAGWRLLGEVVGGQTKKIIETVATFAERAHDLPDSIDAGFKPLIQSGYLANDRMELLNATLANQAALLEHMPENRAAVAMAETKVQVDELAASLDEANKKMEEVLSANHLSRWGRLIGYEGTAKVEGTIKAFAGQTADLAYDAQAALRSGDTQEFARVDAQRRAKLQAAHEHYQSLMKDLGEKQGLRKYGYNDNSANLQDLQSADKVVTNEQGADRQRDQQAKIKERIGAANEAERKKQESYRIEMQADDQHLADSRRTHLMTVGEEKKFWEGRIGAVEVGSLAYLDINKRLGALNQQQLKEGAAMAAKAPELALRSVMTKLAEWRLLTNVTKNAAFGFLEEHKGEFAAGSREYQELVTKQTSLSEEMSREAHERIERFKETQKVFGEEKARLPDNPASSWQRDTARAAADSRDFSNQANAQVAQNRAAYEYLQIQEATGRTMTQMNAMRAIQTVHTQEYGAALLQLEERLKAIQTDRSLTTDEDDKARKIFELQTQIRQVKSNRQVQTLEDAFNIKPPNTSLLVGATSALEEFVRATTDAGQTLKNVFSSALSSTNEGIIRSMTERHTRGEHIFGNIGAGIFKNVAGAELSGAEGSVLKAFGFGGEKTLGASEAHAMWVRFTGMFHGSSGGASPMKLLGDAGLPGGKSGGFLSAAGGFLSRLIPGFAGGVDNFGGGWAMVGEQGPELLNLPRGSSVMPNHKLGEAMGGGNSHVWNIDARGATDPAQVRAQIMAAAPHIIAAANAKYDDSKRRAIGK